jgi:trehalose 6-phosphate phosphatase
MVADGAARMPSADVRAAMAPLLEDPGASAVVTDFDGTISPTVEDPEAARPLDGTIEVLSELSRVFGVVAVVSGRPLSFLLEQLGGTPPAVRMAGLYGLERRGPEGTVVAPAAEPWVPVVSEVVERLRSAPPPRNVLIEDKHLGVTVHWRRALDAASWVAAAVSEEAARSGLRVQPGKMSLELRPPLDVDKGTSVRDLVGESAAACYLGDDTGDLPAFAVLAALSADRGMTTVSAAVVGPETPSEVVDAADLTVDGPEEALGLLRWLAGQARIRLTGRP